MRSSSPSARRNSRNRADFALADTSAAKGRSKISAKQTAWNESVTTSDARDTAASHSSIDVPDASSHRNRGATSAARFPQYAARPFFPKGLTAYTTMSVSHPGAQAVAASESHTSRSSRNTGSATTSASTPQEARCSAADASRTVTLSNERITRTSAPLPQAAEGAVPKLAAAETMRLSGCANMRQYTSRNQPTRSGFHTWSDPTTKDPKRELSDRSPAPPATHCVCGRCLLRNSSNLAFGGFLSTRGRSGLKSMFHTRKPRSRKPLFRA